MVTPQVTTHIESRRTPTVWHRSGDVVLEVIRAGLGAPGRGRHIHRPGTTDRTWCTWPQDVLGASGAHWYPPRLLRALERNGNAVTCTFAGPM